MDFKHNIDDTLKLVASDEFGKVIGRAEYKNDENSYLIRYKAGDGRQVQAWWNESAVEPYVERSPEIS